MKTQSENKVKKVSQGHYTYKGLHIVLSYGGEFWNIWYDEDCTKEYGIGIATKRKCVEGIDKYYK